MENGSKQRLLGHSVSKRTWGNYGRSYYKRFHQKGWSVLHSPVVLRSTSRNLSKIYARIQTISHSGKDFVFGRFEERGCDLPHERRPGNDPGYFLAILWTYPFVDRVTIEIVRRCEMAKVLECRDVGFDCDGVVKAETEQEVLAKAAEHAKTVHNITTIPPEVLEKVRSVIREEKS